MIAHATHEADKVDAATLARLHAAGFLPEVCVADLSATGMTNIPPFATLNQTCAALGTPNKSDFRGSGMTP